MAGATRAVFISYRREDTRHIAGRLADRLTDRLGRGQVFMDVETIEPGSDFAAVIAHEVASCGILIALIGTTWETITGLMRRRRLDNPDDLVVLEIRAALERGIPVIPVLVDGARMPDPLDLPEVLQGLPRLQAVRLDHDTFPSDFTVLLNAIDRILPTFSSPDHQPTQPPTAPKPRSTARKPRSTAPKPPSTAPKPRSPVPQRLVTTIKVRRKLMFKSPVEAVAFSPNGHLLSSGGHDGTVRLWDPGTGRPVGEPLSGHSGWVGAVAFSPDGNLLSSGGLDGTVRLWDPTTGRPVGEPLNPRTERVRGVAFSPDGHLLASGGHGSVRLWDPTTGRPVGVPLSGHSGWLGAVAFSPDGHLLASSGHDGTVRLWDPAAGRSVGEPLIGRTGWVGAVDPGWVCAVAFSPDGHLLASSGHDGTVWLWGQ